MAAPLDMLRFQLGRLGKPGMLGILLLLGGLVYLTGFVLPKAAQLQELAAGNERARKASMTEKARAARQGMGLSQRQAFAPEAATALRRLYDAAEESGLDLVQGEYRMQESREEGVRQYQFMLPVYGSYADVRKFLALALNNDPALALNSMQMRREAIEETELDVTLSFTLYLGTAP